MQTIWFPAPVFLLFRRLVNVVSSLSISQHYLIPNTTQDDPKTDSSINFKALTWLSWSMPTGSRSLSLETEGDIPYPEPPKRTQPQSRSRPTHDQPKDIIHKLMKNPVLYEPIRRPRNPVVLCHGLYGFDVRGPETFPMLRTHYWSNVLSILREKVGAEVIVTGVPSTGSVTSRARKMHDILRDRAPGRAINFMAHSMGGLDCRHLITHIKPKEYTPASLTTIATPHRGSPFMDWCTENIGIGKLQQKEKELAALMGKTGAHGPHDSHPADSKSSSGFSLSLSSLPSSFTTLLLSLLDSPAYANLSTTYLTHVFNPATPDDPNVRYFSVAGRIASMPVWHPLWLPKMVLDGFEERERQRYGEWEYDEGGERWGNDGLVTVQSARWGEFLGILEECDHWEMRGARGIELDIWGGSTSGKDEKGTVGAPDEESESGWNLGDWGRLVRAWKREERAAKGAGAAVSERQEAQDERERGGDVDKARLLDESASQRERETGFADEVVKASTEKLSAVFDWIVDQVPSIPPGTGGISIGVEGGEKRVVKQEQEEQEEKAARRSELATKQDLERFYVALCRKLYDEGL